MRLRSLITIFFVLLCCSCASKKVTLYMLSAQQTPRHKMQSHHSRITYVGLEKVQLPVYLQTDKITLRYNNNKLHQDEFHRWAEPLPDNISRVITNTVHNSLRNVDVVTEPWPFNTPIQYRLRVNILRFDSNAQCVSKLVASWSIYDKTNKKLLYKRTKSYRRHNQDNTIEDIVRGMNQTVHRLSGDIAWSISRVVRHH